MGYAELVRALHEETQRQLAEIAVGGASDAAAIADAAARAAAEARAAALAADERAAAEELRRHAARLRLAEERALLVETRGQLERLTAAAGARLDAALDEPLARRLGAELCAEIDGPGWTLRVDPRFVAALREVAGGKAEVVAGEAGELIAGCAGRTLDNRPRSRLAIAWPELEPELCRRLLEEDPSS
jgi:hypothetical protein